MFKKILLGVVILIVVSIVAMVVIFGSLNKPKGNNERILKSNKTSVKKALIIYQPSATNVTSLMADSIAKGLNDGGYEVTLNNPGNDISTDISKYSLVIFGSPTFAGQPLSIETDYISKIKDFSSAKVVLFVTGADISKKDELNVMEKALNGTKSYKKVKFNSGTKEDSKNKAYNLGRELSKE